MWLSTRSLDKKVDASSQSAPCVWRTQVAQGIHDAHARGIIHRDLKPENIFVLSSPHGEMVKVVDFGISKIFSAEDGVKLTQTGVTVGTPQYMPVEQLRGTKDLDGRVDVYALGVVLFEMFAGVRPYDGFTYEEVILKVATTTAPSLGTYRADLDPGLVQVVDRAMARDRDQRIGSMAQLRQEMAPYWSGRGPLAGAPAGQDLSRSGGYPAAQPSGASLGQTGGYARSTAGADADHREPRTFSCPRCFCNPTSTSTSATPTSARTDAARSRCVCRTPDRSCSPSEGALPYGHRGTRRRRAGVVGATRDRRGCGGVLVRVDPSSWVLGYLVWARPVLVVVVAVFVVVWGFGFGCGLTVVGASSEEK